MIIGKHKRLALIGMMLGDGIIQKVSEQPNARLKINHSIKQYRYVLYLCSTVLMQLVHKNTNFVTL